MYGILRPLRTAILPAALAAALFGACGDGGAALPDRVDFNHHVRPILVQKCYRCHGPDSGSRKAGLRLDTYEGATALTREGLRAIDPGHADKSLLLFRINHPDPEMVMPTPASNLRLTDRERLLLERWVAQGAEWAPHWALLPPRPAAPPGRQGHPVDRFLDARLEEEGIPPAGPADRHSLLRRAAFVLTGLPPTPAEQDSFLNDRSDHAYARMIDRYLASPRYGERWARHWMDVVRYAETRGHEFDYAIPGAWRYRDYLIRAFNDDLPFDRFVTEQIAGDLLPDPRTDPTGTINESRLATFFHTLTEGTHSPVDIRKDEADRIDNMIDVTGKAFQALTVACARCHDHKFDPVSARDYYALYGVLESTRFTPVPAHEPRQRQAARELRQLLDTLRASTHAWLRHRRPDAPAPIPLPAAAGPADAPGQGNDGILADFSGPDLQGWRSDGEAFTDGTTLGDPVTDTLGRPLGLRNGRASSRRLAGNLFGALRSPDFTIDTDFIGVLAAGHQASVRIIIDNFQLISFPIYGDLDQKVESPTPVRLTFPVGAWKGHKAYVEVLPGRYEQHVYRQPPDAWVEVAYVNRFDRDWKTPRRKTAGRHATPATLPRGAPPTLLSDAALRLRRLQASLTEPLEFHSGVTDGFGRNSPVFRRGSPSDPSPDRVPRHFLPAVAVARPDMDQAGSGRLALARAITDPANPLTARIMANRVWHHLFGRGLVESVDNFGLQGQSPSHPELLDQLALAFRQEGWSVKRLIRHIMTSAAFQRAVTPPPAALGKDPDNRLLASYPLRRLEAEAIRDAMLAVAGRLDTTRYGPPVPQHVTAFMNGRGRPAASGPPDGNGRRSIYLEVRRNFPDPFLMAFDRPVPATTHGRRTVTNVPAQSLTLLNDPFVADMADRTAARLLRQPDTAAAARVRWLYRHCLGRPPETREIRAAEALLKDLRQAYARSRQPVTPRRLWKDYVHTLFNLKAFIFIS